MFKYLSLVRTVNILRSDRLILWIVSRSSTCCFCLYFVHRTSTCLTVFLTEGKRFFHMSIILSACLGDVYEYDRLSYRHNSTCRPRHTVYVTVVVFVCPYVCTTLVIQKLIFYYGHQYLHVED